MAASYGSENGDQAQGENQPMEPLDGTERVLGLDFGSLTQPAMQKKGLSDKQHQGKKQPHHDHRMHPPHARGEKSIPKVQTNQNVQSAETGEQRGHSRLPRKTPFDVVEERQPLGRTLDTPHRGQQDRCHETYAADPQDNGDDVNRSGYRGVFHRGVFHARRNGGAPSMHHRHRPSA